MSDEHASYRNVTLETIDQAIRDWFDKTVDAHVEFPNGDRRKVSIGFSSGERWITARQKKGIRDTNGVLILPIISIRRSGIEPVPSMSSLGTETATLQISKRITAKTNDLANLHVNRTPAHRTPAKPVLYEITTIPFPDRSILTYEIQVQTQYILQMNTILEKMFHELDVGKAFVAPFENDNRHPPIGIEFDNRTAMNKEYVVGFFDSTLADGGNFEEFTDQERIVRFSTSIRVPAVLQLNPEGEQSSLKIERTSFLLNFGTENSTFVDNQEDMEKIFGIK